MILKKTSLRFYIVLIGKKECQGFLYITVLSAQPSYRSGLLLYIF